MQHRLFSTGEYGNPVLRVKGHCFRTLLFFVGICRKTLTFRCEYPNEKVLPPIPGGLFFYSRRVLDRSRRSEET
jgi:hypothetical protein